MAKYHCTIVGQNIWQSITIFENIYGCTTLLKLVFVKLEFAM